MEETEYHLKADPALHELLEFAEELEEKFELEVEYDSGVLSITMPDARQYVINKHMPSRQIWVSSPYSGAGYFEFNGQEWAPKRAEKAQGRNLQNFIKEEVQAHLTNKTK